MSSRPRFWDRACAGEPRYGVAFTGTHGNPQRTCLPLADFMRRGVAALHVQVQQLTMPLMVPGETLLSSVLRPRGMKAKLLLLLELALRSMGVVVDSIAQTGGMLREAVMPSCTDFKSPGLVPVPQTPEDEKAIA